MALVEQPRPRSAAIGLLPVTFSACFANSCKLFRDERHSAAAMGHASERTAAVGNSRTPTAFWPELPQELVGAIQWGFESPLPHHVKNSPEKSIAKEPVSFTWYAQMADQGDAIDDPSIAWPPARKLVKLVL
jgi:hypothetical protein